jgi:hypothetical protein
LLVHDLAELSIVHLAAANNLESLLLEGIQSGSLCDSHLFLDISELDIALVNLNLKHFNALLHLHFESVDKVFTWADVSEREGALISAFGGALGLAVPNNLSIVYYSDIIKLSNFN